MPHLSIPRTLSIRGRRWRVVTKARIAVDGADCWAATDAERRVIELAAGMDPDRAEAKFLHEALHAIWPPGVVSDEQEETLVGLLEEPLQDVIRAMARRRR